MFCNTCKEEILPEWKFAVVNNFCPRCGGKVMDEKTQELMQGLSEAMSKMSDPIAIVSWLMSNYNLTKIGEYDPVITKPQVKPVKTTTSQEKQDSKYSPIINHIHKMSGLDKVKTSKEFIAQSEASSNETLVSIDDEDGVDAEYEPKEFDRFEDSDEIDQMMTPSSFTLESVLSDIKNKKLAAQESVLSGTVKPNSFTRAG